MMKNGILNKDDVTKLGRSKVYMSGPSDMSNYRGLIQSTVSAFHYCEYTVNNCINCPIRLYMIHKCALQQQAKAVLEEVMSGSHKLKYTKDDIGMLLVNASPTEIGQIPNDNELYKSLKLISEFIYFVNDEQVSNITK